MHTVYMCHKLTRTILAQDFWKHDSGIDNASTNNCAINAFLSFHLCRDGVEAAMRFL